MAIFTTNRTSLNEDVENIIADEHCSGDFGAIDMITESYYNDQAIFEAVLKRDVLSIIAEQDGSNSAKEKSDTADKNIIQKMWSKICEMIDTIISKIKALADKFYAKLREFANKKIRGYLKKHLEKFHKNDLSNMHVKNFHMWRAKRAENISGKALADAIRSQASLDMYAGKSAEEISTILKTKRKAMDAKIYGRLLGSSTPLNAQEFRVKLHEAVFETTVNNTPFNGNGGLKTEVVNTLKVIGTDSSNVAMVKNAKRELTKDLSEKKKKAKANLKAAKKGKNEDAIAEAKAVSNTISALQRVAGTTMSAMMKEEKAIIMSCWKLFVMGTRSKYAADKEGAKNESYDVDEDYLNALGESAEFEAEMYLDCNGTEDAYDWYDESADEFDAAFPETSYSFI